MTETIGCAIGSSRARPGFLESIYREGDAHRDGSAAASRDRASNSRCPSSIAESTIGVSEVDLIVENLIVVELKASLGR